MAKTFTINTNVSDSDGKPRMLNMHGVMKMYNDPNNSSQSRVVFVNGVTESLTVPASSITDDSGMIVLTDTNGAAIYVNFNNVHEYWTDFTGNTKIIFRDGSFDYVVDSPATINTTLGVS